MIPIADHLTIYICYGANAYHSGLRFTDSKMGILSDGTDLTSIASAFRYGFLFCCMILMYALAVLIQIYKDKINIKKNNNQTKV